MLGKNKSASIEEKIYKEILGSNKKNKKNIRRTSPTTNEKIIAVMILFVSWCLLSELYTTTMFS